MNDKDKAFLDAVLAKGPDFLDETEAAVIRAREAYLTDAQKAEFASVLKAPKAKPAKDAE